MNQGTPSLFASVVEASLVLPERRKGFQAENWNWDRRARGDKRDGGRVRRTTSEGRWECCGNAPPRRWTSNAAETSPRHGGI